MRLSASVLIGVALLAMLLSVAAGALGIRVLSIRSGSMTPTIAVGDIVLSRSVSPTSIQVGDIVTFHDPALHGALTTHRAVRITRQEGRVDFLTKGDANKVGEQWSVPASGSVGRQVGRIPSGGYVMAWLQSRSLRVGVLVLTGLWLLKMLLDHIWRPEAGAQAA